MAELGLNPGQVSTQSCSPTVLGPEPEASMARPRAQQWGSLQRGLVSGCCLTKSWGLCSCGALSPPTGHTEHTGERLQHLEDRPPS